MSIENNNQNTEILNTAALIQEAEAEIAYPRPAFDMVIPGEIRIIPTLTRDEKYLYALIRNLTSLRGYCWATDEYLRKEMDVSLRTVKRWLRRVIDHGLIRREVIQLGVKKRRRLYLSTAYRYNSKNVCVGSPVTLSWGHGWPLTEERSTKDRYIPLTPTGGDREEIKKNTELGHPPDRGDSTEIQKMIPSTEKAASAAQKQKVPLTEVCKNVYLTDEQIDGLHQRAKGDASIVKKWTQKLSDWKIGNPDRRVKSDYMQIIKWVIKAVAEEEEKEALGKGGSPTRIDPPRQRQNRQINRDWTADMVSVVRSLGMGLYYDEYHAKIGGDRIRVPFDQPPHEFKKRVSIELGIYYDGNAWRAHEKVAADSSKEDIENMMSALGDKLKPNYKKNG